MENEVKEILMQLVDTTNKLVEGQKQTNERLDKLEKDVRIVKLTLENDISPSIKMLSEFHLENSKRLIKLEKDVRDIKDELAINDVIQGLKENNMI